MTHSFGISLVYPGSMDLMKMILDKPLMEGRTKLVMDHLGERSKVVTWATFFTNISKDTNLKI